MTDTKDVKVMVVEDEPDVRMVLTTALRDAGFQVESASNGREAYNAIKLNAPDCITLDLVMPGMSGALLYHKLRRNPKWDGIRVLIISAHTQDELGMEDFKLLMGGKEIPPPDGFLEKPVNVNELVRRVAELTGVEVMPYLRREADEIRRDIVNRLSKVDLNDLKRVKSVLDR